MAQIKSTKGKKKTKKANAKSCFLFAGVSQMILTRIMAIKSSEKIWDYLKGKYEGNKKIQGMKVLNIIREFELKKDERF
uniref:Gag-pol polyprotein n=1 Tax=Phaseolus vulgaris TaxID=3885 RepID=I7A4I6_PHAVU|nr:gag-pol polyprotein [Phaseolus vulgaris]AFN88205.1 gag-pol polyprotein [Phaseolus vulgaris]